MPVGKYAKVASLSLNFNNERSHNRFELTARFSMVQGSTTGTLSIKHNIGVIKMGGLIIPPTI